VQTFGRVAIRWKIVGIVVLTTALALAFAFSILLARSVASTRGDLVENHVAVARVTGENAVTDIAFEDRTEAKRTLAILHSIPTVAAAFLFDERGEPFAAYERGPEASVPRVGPGDPAGSRRFEDGFLVVSEPIVYEDDHYGTIVLVVSTARLAEKTKDAVLTLLVVMIILLAGATLLALRLEHVVSRPILALAALARRISESHDYSVRVPRESEDEIGTLGEGFNDMLEQIERRERERDEADQRTREKSQFLANMSHELRTPLNAIIGFSEILRARASTTLDERELRFLDNINTSGQHLLGIVNDILDLSKIEAGKMEIHPERFPVSQAIDSVCNLMRGVSSRRRITFDVEYASAVPEITADVVKVKQVLYNLLSNAVKFSPEGSSVTIRTSVVEPVDSPLGLRSVRFEIIDRGIGIDPRHHELIFRAFQQVDGSAGRTFEGTGLGLALVRRFVELHGGVIRLESAIGKGTTFTVILPVEFRSGSETDGKVPSGRERAVPGQVLVIEDEEASFAAIRDALEGTEFAVVRATSGAEGLRLAALLRPAAILLDLVLPDLGGFEVLRALKSDEYLRDVPVIVVTILEGNRDLGLALGVDDYLTKPVPPERLLSSLRNHLRAGEADRHVLVIDDDPGFHEIVEACLSSENVRLSHALDGPGGLRMAGADPPSLVILDLAMQEMDGFDVAVRLQQDPSTARIPILVATARELTASDHERLRGRIAAMIEKPELTPARLIALVRLFASTRVSSEADAAGYGGGS
jgi:signal transduction histidine kinase/CheY-like chemotaxis protein